MSDVQKYVDSVQLSIKDHDPRLDSVLYNGGTVLALAASIGATAVVWTDQMGWIPRVLAALAAFLIGIERALGFGQRWGYHRRMRASYEGLRLRLETLSPEDPDFALRLTKILDDLDALRKADQVPAGPGMVSN